MSYQPKLENVAETIRLNVLQRSRSWDVVS